jgi:hypothetical protein
MTFPRATPTVRGMLLLACMLAATLSVGVTAAAAATRPPPERLAPRFHYMGTTQPGAAGDFIFLRDDQPGTMGTLLDDQTGRHYPVPTSPDCGQTYDPVLSTGRLVLLCPDVSSRNGQALDVYALPRGPWKRLPGPTTESGYRCDFNLNTLYPRCFITAAGRDWAQFEVDAYHAETEQTFENLTTGQVTTPKLSPSHGLDLNSPTLTTRNCSPLSIPAQDEITYLGSFALVKQHDPREMPGLTEQYPSPDVLDRCGTHASDHLGTDLTGLIANTKLIAWMTPTPYGIAPKTVHGIMLPSRQHFTLTIPPAFRNITPSISLTNHHLLLWSIHPGLIQYGPGGLWSTPLPKPRSSHHARTR